MKVAKGSSRTVLLTKKYAIKFPFTFYKGMKCRKFWYRLLHGLIANIHELEYKDYRYCFYQEYGIILNVPLFGFKSGLCNIYKRASMLNEPRNYKRLPNIIENKTDSFGIVDGEVMCIDYA